MNCLSRVLGLGALVIGGCAPSAPEPAPVATAPAPPAAVAPTPADQNQVPYTPASDAAPIYPVQKDPRYNARRLFQLFELRRVRLIVGGHRFKAWVMDTPGKRQEGMMFIEDAKIKADEAMLFVFAEPAPQGFWMQNTLMPLDIAYFSKELKLLNVQHGKPKDETTLPSMGDSQYVVEFKSGTCKRLGIKPGATLNFPPGIRADL